MSEALEWSERVPPLAENRIRYMVLLIGLTIALLAIAGRPYEAIAPSSNFFSTKMPPVVPDSQTMKTDFERKSVTEVTVADTAYCPVKTREKNYKSRFDPVTLSYQAIDTNDGKTYGSDESPGNSLLVTSSSLGEGNGVFSDQSDESVLTFDSLLASTGLQTTPVSGNGQLNISLPESLSDLIRVIGDYENDKNVKVLGRISASGVYSKTARAMAINSLAKFGKSASTVKLLSTIICDSNEPFALREISINTLVDIDGEKFEKFFIDTCVAMIGPRSVDVRLFELLTLAAYRDISIYESRSMQKIVPVIEGYASQSKSIAALCSIKLRFKEYKSTQSELQRYERSANPLVLSSLVYYLGQNAAQDELAREMLTRAAKQTVNPQVRIMANNALSAKALD
jgi:hypothetical protein